jgi:phenylacetate-CoA ligase
MIKKLIAKYIYEPMYNNFYRRDSTNKYYNEYKKAQWNSLKVNKRIQKEKLFLLIDYASKNIDYYKRIIKQKKIKFTKETIFEDINFFPILTKQIIRNEFNNLYKKPKKIVWYENTSGGSTGEPIRLLQDNNYYSQGTAFTKLQYEWANYYYGETQIKLWGSEKDIFNEKEKFKHRFANYIKSIHVLNAFLMTEKKKEQYVEFININKPIMILSYVQSINELSKFIKKKKIKVFSPKSIMTSAGVLYPDFRKRIENAFGCPVFNRYGSREVGNIASECEKHEGLHVSTPIHYIEILNKNLELCKEGETGEIYITLLTNYTMPLIRYKIGDMATYTDKNCSCGRGFPLIKHIIGRDVDLFINTKNESIDGEYFTHLFYFKKYINKFQVIQKSKSEIKILLVLRSKIDEQILFKDFDEIKKKIQIVMGKDCEVDYKIKTKIDPSKSGKFRYTIREF